MKKIVTVLVLFGLLIGFVGCSMPTEETKKEVVVETPKEETFEYKITKGGCSRLNDNLIYTYYIDANKPFTIECRKDFVIDGRRVSIYVRFPRSLVLTNEYIETLRPSFKVVER